MFSLLLAFKSMEAGFSHPTTVHSSCKRRSIAVARFRRHGFVVGIYELLSIWGVYILYMSKVLSCCVVGPADD